MADTTPQKRPIECIGIILDGNRRWAKERGLPQLEGHRRGFNNLKSVARWVRDRNIPHLVVFAFSTENFNRTSEEVSYLMGMIRAAVREEASVLSNEGIRLRFAGDRSRLEPDIQAALTKAEEKSAWNSKCTLWICLSYGGRAEIAAAAAVASKSGDISEQSIAANLWTAGMPDPDIIIRTGGQRRLSNFLLWQSAYSELFFLDMLWPDFGEKDLDGVLSEFTTRKRNFGI